MAVERVVGLKTRVFYEGLDVSARVDPYLLELSYTDNIEGSSGDTIDLIFEDRDGLLQGRLYPRKGAEVSFEFGFDKPGSNPFESVVGFKIDNIEVKGPPDTVKWHAIGQQPSAALHTRISNAWKDTTLEGIAGDIAAKHGLKLLIETDQPIKLTRVDQVNESDIALLKRLAKQYGLVLSLKAGKEGSTAVLAGLDKLMSRAPIFDIRRKNCTRFEFKDNTIRATKGASTKQFDFDAKKLVETTIEVPKQSVFDGLLNSFQEVLNGKGHEERSVGVRQSPEAHILGVSKAEAAKGRTVDLAIPGNPRLVSGVMVNLPEEDWQKNSGHWLVTKSAHKLNVATGYVTTISLKKK